MRELAIRKSQPSILPLGNEIAEPAEEKPISLKRLFHGWLHIVPAREAELPHDANYDTGIRRVSPAGRPKEIAGHAPRSLTNGGQLEARWRSLTIRDLLSINRATVRESDAHRHWPTDVVLTFMAAEVVKRKPARC